MLAWRLDFFNGQAPNLFCHQLILAIFCESFLMLNLMMSGSSYRASVADLEKFHILANPRNLYCEGDVLIICLSFPTYLVGCVGSEQREGNRGHFEITNKMALALKPAVVMLTLFIAVTVSNRVPNICDLLDTNRFWFECHENFLQYAAQLCKSNYCFLV